MTIEREQVDEGCGTVAVRLEELRVATAEARPGAGFIARVSGRIERRHLVRQAWVALLFAAAMSLVGLALLRRSDTRLAQTVLLSADPVEGAFP